MPRKVRAVVIHAASDPGMQQLVGALESALAGMGCSVSSKPAAQAQTPDLAAADLVLLGSAPEADRPVHRDFAELLRALRGMTLAGGAVGCFSPGAESTLQALRQALQDCEVPLPEGFLFKARGAHRAGDLEAWLRPLVQRAEEIVRAG